ncbi:MAG: hypothetical protein AB7U97_10270, partial [Pirellulales bacterium]
MNLDGSRLWRHWLTLGVAAGLALCVAGSFARDFGLLGSAATPELVLSSPWQPPLGTPDEQMPDKQVINVAPAQSSELPVEEAPSAPWQPPAEPPAEPVAEPESETDSSLDELTIDIPAAEVVAPAAEVAVVEPPPAQDPEPAPTTDDAPSKLASDEPVAKPENEEYLAALDADLAQEFVAKPAPPLPVVNAPLPSTAWTTEVAEGLPTAPPLEAFVEAPVDAPVPMQAAAPVVTPYSPTTAELTRQLLPAIQHAYGLARHGAIYAARTEFIQVLRRIAQSKDAAENSDVHSHALAAALRALDEADDFAPRGAQLEGEMDVTLTASAHRTPVLEQCPAPPRPVEAIALYHEYARHQFARAVANEQAGSAALYALGKMHNRLASGRDGDVGHERKALVLFLAALDVAPGNHLAANEIGVLFARGGRAWEASIMFRHAIDVAPSATTYHNLAVVDRQLGYHDQASANEYQAQQLAQRDRAAGAAS